MKKGTEKKKIKPMYPEVPLRYGGIPFADGLYPSTGYNTTRKEIYKKKTEALIGKSQAPYISLLCPSDGSLLSYECHLKANGPKRTKLNFPVFSCPLCKQEYSFLKEINDMRVLECLNKRFVNINPDKADMNKRSKRNAKMKCWLWSVNPPHSCFVCNCRVQGISLGVEADDGWVKRENVMYCGKCNTIFAPYTMYNTHKKVFDFLNAEKYTELADEALRKEEEKRKIKEQRRQERENKKKTNEEESEKICKSYADHPQISIVDLVVKTNTFRCMHNHHSLQNIIASVDVLTKDGEEKKMNVSAGYCPECKSFFIMESTYEAIKRKGNPLCKICDEKSFISSTSSNGMVLAQESILMQYGYNVNQNEGLSPKTRQHILAILIDNGIATNSEIISYLNFFISQRQNQEKYKVAIRKWETDRFFVENYFSGDLKRYGINKIYRS